VDLSTDLNALLPLVAPLLSGHSDMAIGSRLARGSRVVRGAKREVISRGYNLLLRAFLGVGFSDAQCGFKAIRASAARKLLPLVADTSWFFDTELLLLAERAGLRIHEVPVDWVDDADSRVDIVTTALADLRGMVRVSWALARGTTRVPVLRAHGIGDRSRSARGLAWQVPRFLAIGIASTLAYVLLYLLFRGVIGAQAANAAALLLTAVANTAANRRLTFGVRGRAGAARHQFRGLIAFGTGLALTSAALWALHALRGSGASGRGAEVAVLIAANLLATAVRFALYRGWVFGDSARMASAPSPPQPPAALPLPALPPSPASFPDPTHATWSTR
jgi:putative flippase GtrA